MPGDDVDDFMAQHADQLILIVRRLDESAIDIDETARECKGVDLGCVDDREVLGQRASSGLGRNGLTKIGDV